MRLLYSTALYLLLPFLLLRLLWRSRKMPQYRQRLAERFGFLPKQPNQTQPLIWVHAVSVGEVVAATALIENLLTHYPNHSVLVTTSTPAGSQLMLRTFGQRVSHSYAPWDLPGSVRRFFLRAQPKLLVLLETELWPNWIAHCKANNCQVLLASARMSERSAAGYKKIGTLGRSMFSQLDKIACQSQLDADRLLDLGISEQALTITGSLKYDIEIIPAMREQGAELSDALATEGRLIFLAASTHAAEEPAIYQAFRRLCQTHPQSLLILAPRQPERFKAVYTAAQQEGWPVARHSQNQSPENEAAILLCDTIGDLAALYGTADFAFIGGSLINHGGHNPIEAALWGVPILMGQHVFNFAQITQDLEVTGGLQFVRDANELENCVLKLAADVLCRQSMGVASRELVENNRGALDMTMREISELLDVSVGV